MEHARQRAVQAGAEGDNPIIVKLALAAEAVDRALHGLKGAAANLGLTSIASLAENLRHAGVDHAIPERVAAEIARVRALPDLKKAA